MRFAIVCDYKSQNRNRKIPIFLATYSIALCQKTERFGFAFVIYNHKLVISCRLQLEKPLFLCKNRNSTKIPLAPQHKRALSFENTLLCIPIHGLSIQPCFLFLPPLCFLFLH